ncbi:amidohydrolase family protein [Occultella gossypii]|uniref:Amidohydrolase family protein n=1 Tax=Occultella gossypii TaxID=2800820 RepID=A0ABS7SBQ9_9MICO|nr:amidohydrolase family protein [Occultella gossypii]MBZ2197777.1 amidohydrolase family protein [Occultella gossypii]
MRIDAHHHVWDLAVHPQDWIGPELAPVIGRDFDVEQWLAAAEPTGVSHAVIVQTVPQDSETPYLLDLAAQHEHVLGVVGWVPFGAPDLMERLDALADHPASDLLVGLRDLSEQRADPAWLAGPEAARTFAAAGERDLTIDLLVRGEHLAAAAEAVRAHPDTSFVVDHLAKPDLDQSTPGEWAALIEPLASAPNVALKFSGYATQTADLGAADLTLAGYLNAALEAFGPRRIMFGSDWPVCLIGGSYAQVVAAAEAALEVVDADDALRGEFFTGAATRWYGLDPLEAA